MIIFCPSYHNYGSCDWHSLFISVQECSLRVYPSKPCGLEKLSQESWTAFLQRQSELSVCETGHEPGECDVSQWSIAYRVLFWNGLQVDWTTTCFRDISVLVHNGHRIKCRFSFTLSNLLFIYLLCAQLPVVVQLGYLSTPQVQRC